MLAPLALLAGLPALLLGGCFTGLSSNQQPQQTYVLRLQSPSSSGGSTGSADAAASATQATPRAPNTAAAAAQTATLEVMQPMVAAGLGSDAIAVLRPGERLDVYSGARWAAPVPSMLQALTIDELRGDGRFGLVEPDTGPFDARYFLSLEVSHFEADYAGDGPPTVRVAISGTLGRRADRSVLQSFSAQSAVPAEADRMQAVITAFQQATNQVLAQLGRQLSAPSTVAAQP